MNPASMDRKFKTAQAEEAPARAGDYCSVTTAEYGLLRPSVNSVFTA
jgi:hypothetical protein